MCSRTSLLWLLASASIAVCLAPPHAAAQDISDARQAELKNLVLQDCGSCHGMTMKGGLGSPLLPDSLAQLETAAVAGIVLDGIPGTPMPPWRGLLSETDAQWIARALKTGVIK